MKYIEEGRLITVKGEEGMVISKLSAIPYTESTEQAKESLY